MAEPEIIDVENKPTAESDARESDDLRGPREDAFRLSLKEQIVPTENLPFDRTLAEMGKNSSGGDVKIEKDRSGNITRYEDANNLIDLKYDSHNRLIEAKYTSEDGKLSGLYTINYDDKNGKRVSTTVGYDPGGSVLNRYEQEQVFRNGKLAFHQENDDYGKRAYWFDTKGNQVKSVDSTGNAEVVTDRTFHEDGRVDVLVRESGIGGSIVKASYDANGNQIGTKISQWFDESGKEIGQLHTTVDGNNSFSKYFENNKLKANIEIENPKFKLAGGDGVLIENGSEPKHIKETHFDAEGLEKTIDVSYFPGQSYLPTKIEVKNHYGKKIESVDISYETTDDKRLVLAMGLVARVKSVQHETISLDGTQEVHSKQWDKNNDRRGQIAEAWSHIHELSKKIGPIYAPIRTENIRVRMDLQKISNPLGQTAQEILLPPDC